MIKEIFLTEEDANNLLALVENMSQTAEIENKLDKTKKYIFKFEEA